ncbi:MAG: hypothetical protein AB7O66_24935, partial [Limisphaerales bacterium]
LETFFRAVVGVGIFASHLRTDGVEPSGAAATSVVAGKEIPSGGKAGEGKTGSIPTSSPSAVPVGQADEERLTFGRHWNRWFDGTMDRVSERFAAHMRLWTVGFSFLVAFGGGLDALGLFSRLSADPEYRAMMVAGIERVASRASDAGASRGAEAPTDDAQARERIETQVAELKALIGENADLGIFSMEGPFAGGVSGFLGRLVSVILLSLGAPFWFNALKKMSNLRPSLANKEGEGK